MELSQTIIDQFPFPSPYDAGRMVRWMLVVMLPNPMGPVYFHVPFQEELWP